MSKKERHVDPEANMNMVFAIRDKVKYEEYDGLIRIVKDQNHWTQKGMRKLGAKIPEKTYMSLDENGSAVFRLIDGKRTIREIGEQLAETNEEASTELYERLLLFINHLENTERWIVNITEKGR